MASSFSWSSRTLLSVLLHAILTSSKPVVPHDSTACVGLALCPKSFSASSRVFASGQFPSASFSSPGYHSGSSSSNIRESPSAFVWRFPARCATCKSYSCRCCSIRNVYPSEFCLNSQKRLAWSVRTMKFNPRRGVGTTSALGPLPVLLFLLSSSSLLFDSRFGLCRR